ncbi:MAG: superoxide dismutase, Ni [Chloroflexi bacterium]|nr:superoxide dismutase, Ni [Chloroflexota bacterium]|tara:strand:+ start:209 stop:682 length:474 start_codon:yes stop_codon:yes gene_type:complete
MKFQSIIKNLSLVADVDAHCDIPCGIYDPIVAKIAAQTVLKMAVRLEAVDFQGGPSSVDVPNSVVRFVHVKEEHAQKVKEELNILWADYFKPEHLEKYPNLHELFWNANKLAGANKQSVSSDSAKKLVQSVDEIATIFWATKGVEYNDSVADIRFGS